MWKSTENNVLKAENDKINHCKKIKEYEKEICNCPG